MKQLKAKLAQSIMHAEKQTTHRMLKVSAAAEGRKFAYKMCLYWISEMERKNGN